MSKKIVFYELNEVPYRIFDYFAELLPQSAIKKLLQNSTQIETYAEDYGHLSPWVTWPTLHRGVLNSKHEISDFGQNLKWVNEDFPSVWNILTEREIKVGVFGSLHTYPLPIDVNKFEFYVPDTFAAGPECFPKQYSAFQDFNLAMAGNSASQVSSGITWKEAAKFLITAPALGLTGTTVTKILKQLAHEQFDKNKLVRRRTTQAQISFDFYFNALCKKKPDISFFFTNHVASSLHRYWPALFPFDYETLKYDKTWLDTWSKEIRYTIDEVEYQLSRLMRFVESNPDTILCLCTSMGQEAVQQHEQVKSQVIISSHSRLMTQLGLHPSTWEARPAMVPQYNFYINDNSRPIFTENISKLTVNGKDIAFTQLEHGIIKIDFVIRNPTELIVEFDGSRVDAEKFGFSIIDMQDAAGANAYHIPQGMFIIYDPRKRIQPHNQREQISTLEIAPSLLKNFGIQKPDYMEGGFTL